MCKLLLFSTAFFLLSGCKKSPVIEPVPVLENAFTEYVIPSGQHEAIGNINKILDVSEMKFTVKFDSSAIYKSIDPANQFDINKLYGFADNNQQHQLFSARFGWRWSDGALRLFAYDYNNGVRESKELGTVTIGTENKCSIKVMPASYLFTLNNKVDTMPRQSIGATAKGYQLYPYFGGDEVAPHDVRVWIRVEP